MEAVEHIHRDLAQLKRRRVLALSTYAGIIAVFFGILWLRPSSGLPRDTAWMVAFGALLLAALLGAAVTIGYPLVSRTVVHIAAGVVGLVCVGALLLVMDPTIPTGDAVRSGMPCFMYGTAVAAIAMVVLGIISGRVWRRFPDPGFPLALGMTGIGLAALHMQCGHAGPLHLFVFHLAPLAVVYVLAHRLVRRRGLFMRGR